jgi:hypothetical protein
MAAVRDKVYGCFSMPNHNDHNPLPVWDDLKKIDKKVGSSPI